jgi:hypothetical protein
LPSVLPLPLACRVLQAQPPSFQPPILRFGFNFNKFSKKVSMINIKDTLCPNEAVLKIIP